MCASTAITNTHVNGAGDVTILTNDLALKGATVTGNSVTADVQNPNTLKSNSVNIGKIAFATMEGRDGARLIRTVVRLESANYNDPDANA
ncbi:hemagglutinin repeat-containing protein [Rhizobium sp. YK2]|uniref:hemagglutinin repeat-containing protein n=1 Tax=Rhizobium sp. YK2 TaxID=1860096 RepID=UPI00084C9D96|nr:hemagglutinin repeat-containing protein [Rhizobium sp. YK2]OEC97164.1 hypothetical protein A9Z06_27495 [Rhizobium sp. YK2]